MRDTRRRQHDFSSRVAGHGGDASYLIRGGRRGYRRLCRPRFLGATALAMVADTISGDHPAIKTVGLIGTTGTISGGLFQNRLATAGIQTIVPDGTHQAQVMRAIYDIKNIRALRSRKQITSDLVAVAESLISGGAQGIVAGCTEIPLALEQQHLSVPYFDALTILALAAIIEAGRTPEP